MQFRNSNVSIEEYYRLHGTLTRDDIETLLDIAAEQEKRGDIKASLQEVANAFPAEDFLQHIISRLIKVTKRIRSADTKTELERIVASIEDLELEVFNASEYGIDILKNLLK